MSDDTEFDYRVEYAESEGSQCTICKLHIEEGSLRIGTTIPLSWRDSDWQRWHHFNCFLAENELRSTADIANFDNIRWDDQQCIEEMIYDGIIASGENIIPLMEDLFEYVETLSLRRIQNDEMWSRRNNLRELNVDHLRLLLDENNQQIQEDTNESKLMDTLMDLMTFGTLNPCPECQGQLEYVSRRGHKCTGNFSEWVKCETLLVDPSRSSFEVPGFLKWRYYFLRAYESSVTRRIINTRPPTDYSDNHRHVFQEMESRKKTLTCKFDFVVEDAELSNSARVYKGEDIYSVTLALADIQSNLNNYYKMQLLVVNEKTDVYELFCCWGRIGKPGSYNQCKMTNNLTNCLETFADIFKEKTGNEWCERQTFVKHIDKMYALNVNYSNNNLKKLHESVRNLTKLIFCNDETLSDEFNFEIDPSRMPLGKLSKNQILIARDVLTELIWKKEPSRFECIEASNKFYTMIAHNFGQSQPPILDTEEIIHTEFELLESLLKFESDNDMIKDPIDAHYRRLRTEINLLDRSTRCFEYIQTYVANTHGIAHREWNLEIDEVFVLRRLDESYRYELCGNVSNKKLLWHGSPTEKYNNILSEGLKPAPPDVELNGAMFGEGIYFSDRVSHAARFCRADRRHPVGLLLLCEVELGNMYKRYGGSTRGSDLRQEMPGDCDSMKGIGRTQPNPNEMCVMEDGVEIPLGTGMPSGISPDLLYNEYVVYKPSQVHLRFLVKMKFQFRV